MFTLCLTKAIYKKPTLHSYVHKTRNNLWPLLEETNKRLNLVTEH